MSGAGWLAVVATWAVDKDGGATCSMGGSISIDTAIKGVESLLGPGNEEVHE